MVGWRVDVGYTSASSIEFSEWNLGREKCENLMECQIQL